MYRAYFFGNMYLSSIQQGIQALHVVGDMSVKYMPEEHVCDKVGAESYYDWAANHKTVVLLNAGDSQDIEAWESFFEGTEDGYNAVRLGDSYDGYSPYPFDIFREEGIESAASCFGVILPAKIYEGAKRIKGRLLPDQFQNWKRNNMLTLTIDGVEEEYTYTNFEKVLMQRMNRLRLAT